MLRLHNSDEVLTSECTCLSGMSFCLSNEREYSDFFTTYFNIAYSVIILGNALAQTVEALRKMFEIFR